MMSMFFQAHTQTYKAFMFDYLSLQCKKGRLLNGKAEAAHSLCREIW